MLQKTACQLRIEFLSYLLTGLAGLLALLASVGGLFLKDLYQDVAFINQVWFGNDIITLFLAIPLLLISTFLSRRFYKARFLWLGTLWYMIYNYFFYVFGASLNKLFLVHVLILILSSYAFILLITSLDKMKISEALLDNSRVPFKRIAVYLIFFGLFIGSLWIKMSLDYVITGIIPVGISQTGHKAAVVFGTDLTLLVSPLIVGAVLLWNKNPWGLIISATLCVKGCLYPLVLALGGFLAYQKTGTYDPFTPAYLILGAGCLLCLLFLLLPLPIKNCKTVKASNIDQKGE